MRTTSDAGACNEPRTRPLDLVAWPAVIFAVAFGAYVPSLRSGFTNWDDGEYVHTNPLLIGETRAERMAVLWPPWRPYFTEYAPFTHLTLLCDHYLGGRQFRAWPFHLTASVLHALNATLIFLIVRRIERGTMIAAAAALVFALHPVQVECVSWVSQRKTLVGTAFFLLSLLAYLQWRRDGGRWGRGSFWAWVSLTGFVAALFSKQHTVVLPAILVLYELTVAPVDETGIKARALRLLRTTPWWVMALMGVLLGWLGQEKAGALTRLPGGGGGAAYVATMLPVLWRYVLISILPGGPMSLNAMHGPPEFATFREWHPLAALLVSVLALSALAVLRPRRILFWAGWFLVALSPASNIIPLPILMAERYLYVSIAAVGVMVGMAVQTLWNGPKWAHRLAAVVALGLVAATYGLLTLHRQAVWQDSGPLWRDAVMRSPFSITVRNNLGEWYLQKQGVRQAEQQFRIVLNIQPTHPGGLVNMAKIVAERGRLLEAERMFQQALQYARMNDTRAVAHLGLALIAQKLYRDPRSELEHFEEALRWNRYIDQAPQIQQRIEELRRQLGQMPPSPIR